MNNFYKMIFLMTMASGTLISVSSCSWIGAWMGLEINLLSFIPILNMKKNSFSSESSMKYFLIQAMASTSFLLSVISLMTLNSFNDMPLMKSSMMLILNSSLFMKMGAAPLHFWFPEVLSNLNWSQSMILLTWQKIAPMMLSSYTLMNNKWTYFIIICSSIVGSVIGLNQIMMQKILAYSSINHMSWMITSMMFSELTWMIYFAVYVLITFSLTVVMKMYNIINLKQMFTSMNNSMLMKFSFVINFLSLGGLPPFIGFFPKWMVIQNMINENLFLLTLLMILFNLITLFFYLRVSFSSLALAYSELLPSNLSTKSSFMLFFFNMISLTGLLIATILINAE